MNTILFIASMILLAMIILVTGVIVGLIVYEVIKEKRWLKSFLEKRK